jgi:alanine dehydrogenase
MGTPAQAPDDPSSATSLTTRGDLKRLDFDFVRARVTAADLIEPLRRGFAQEVEAPSRTHYEIGSGESLLVMPCWRKAGHLGVKIVTVFPENVRRDLPSVNGEYLLLSAETGQSLALIDGRALTLLRTAAVSALAADLLAIPRPDSLLMVGTGALAPYLIEAHLAIRSYRSVAIWGRNLDKANRLVEGLARKGWPVRLTTELEKAAREANVISCATMAESALIKGQWLREASHLDLVGSFRPSMREADIDCFRDAFVVVDTLDALQESGDLIGPLQSKVIRREDIVHLSGLVSNPASKSRARRTVFKSVGCAVADLAAAEWIHQQCAGPA